MFSDDDTIEVHADFVSGNGLTNRFCQSCFSCAFFRDLDNHDGSFHRDKVGGE